MRTVLIALSLLFALNVNAQVYYTAVDTLTDTDVAYFTSSRQETGQIVGFQMIMTSLSGTMSVDFKPQGSMNNEDWTDLADSYTYSSGDTVAIIQTPETWTSYIRIKASSSGTQSTEVRGLYKVTR